MSPSDKMTGHSHTDCKFCLLPGTLTVGNEGSLHNEPTLTGPDARRVLPGAKQEEEDINRDQLCT